MAKTTHTCTLCSPRDDPRAAEVEPFFFGHKNVAPRRTGFLDLGRDIEAGNTVAIRLGDEDAVRWRRTFDIALVTEVCRRGCGDDQVPTGELQIQYYVSDKERDGNEEDQIMGTWKLGNQTGKIHRDSIFMTMWVNQGNNKLYRPWLPSFREQLTRLRRSAGGGPCLSTPLELQVVGDDPRVDVEEL